MVKFTIKPIKEYFASKEKEGKKLLFFEKIGDSKTSKEERLKNLVRILEKQGFKIKKINRICGHILLCPHTIL